MGRYPKSKEDEIVVRREGAKKWDADGNEVVDTIELYCLDMASPEIPFIFPLSTTSLKYGKSFATRMRALRVDGQQVKVSWAGVWEISTVKESNEKGSWYTLGNTPDFQRLITVQERDEYVFPAIEMLKTAAVDYSAIDAAAHAEGEDSVEY